MYDEKEVLHGLNCIKSLGCKIAIDDFGTEFSNFARLLNMNFDFIKIDGSFIKDIHKNENSYKIAKTITQFAHSTNAKVIAECVHSKEVQKIIKELKIDFSQGFFFSTPTSAENAE